MTVETLMDRYGHHHPDYLQARATRSSRHRNRHRNAATEREQTATNVTKIADYFKRSAVAHLVRDEGVAGSNPATPTTFRTSDRLRGQLCGTKLTSDDLARPIHVDPAALSEPRALAFAAGVLAARHARR